MDKTLAKKKNIFQRLESDTKRFIAIIVISIVVLSVLSIFTPSKQVLQDQISDNMKELVQSEKDSDSKTVIKTYNSLGFINYTCYETTGNAARKEAYVGFLGMTFDATRETYKVLNFSNTFASIIKKDNVTGEKTVEFSEKSGVEIKAEKQSDGTYAYFVDGKAIEKQDGFTYSYDTEREEYLAIMDSYGDIIASEANDDKIDYVDGKITINGTRYRDEAKSATTITGELVNFTYRMLGCGQSVLYGAKLTIFLSVTSVLTGFFLSIFLALGKISKNKLINLPCRAYIFFFRGTPLMIQLFVIYFALPGMFENFTWTGLFSGLEATSKGAFLAAYIAFSLNIAAYCAEIVRAAIQSIDRGQHEAAKALGMSYTQTMGKIIIPQSVRRMIPPVANEFIMVLKDASLVFVISLMDITTISKVISSKGNFLVFIPALIIYLIITAFFTFIFTKVEKKCSIYE